MESMRRKPLSEQILHRKAAAPEETKEEYDGSSTIISTGSTLLDLAISGGRFYGGGIPAGILVEIFGPSGCGKTVLLCELAGAIRRAGGQVSFFDPEARINSRFARIFGLDFEDKNVLYSTPNTIPEVFSAVREWQPTPKGKVHGVFADSLAALSTELEMGNDEGDKMGGRRAKEFSQETRRTCREIPIKNILMVCSNQIRQKMNAGPFESKYTTPGGEAIPFYASLRLKVSPGTKNKDKRTLNGKEVTRVSSIETVVEVFKSSVWKPYRTATVCITFDYGIDDIRENLKFIKTYSKESVYTLGGKRLSNSLEDSIQIVESDGLEKALKAETIEQWELLEKLFEKERKPKVR